MLAALVSHRSASLFLPPFRTRAELPALLDGWGLQSGVELGVERGIFSATMLRGWHSCVSYTQVDLWSAQALEGSHYTDSQRNHNLKYETMLRQRIGRQNCTASFAEAHEAWPKQTCGVALRKCRNYTTDCAADFDDASVDFVYVDALHDRVGVLRDLQTWWPKLRTGGVMAGHDYMTKIDLDSMHGAKAMWPQQHNIDGTFDAEGGMVKGAVDDFFSCAVIAGDGHIPRRHDLALTNAPGTTHTGVHCDHFRTVIVAYGAQGKSQETADHADDWPRSWYVRK